MNENEKSEIEAREVSAGYSGDIVIEGLSLKVTPGDMIGIVGPNGSGKTSFLKVLSRALKPEKGAVFLDGGDLYGLGARQVARKLAVVPQESPQAFDFSTLEIVLMGRNPHLGRFQSAGEEDMEKARLAMEKANVWHLADRSIMELSGGERQGVIIAQALAQSPSVLLLDEPTQHLDINHRLSLFEVLSEMCREGISVLIVVHDINLAARYCRKIVLVKEGREFASGSPEEVLIGENILEVFGVDSMITRDSATGKPNVVFLQANQSRLDKAGMKVHLICGGSTGGVIMRKLLQRGYYVTAGVLNSGDGDEEVGRALELKMAVEAPFSHISENAHALNMDLIGEANLIIVTEIQVGPGNLRNLEAALEAARIGKRVIFITGEPVEERDFTGGSAVETYRKLKESGATRADGPEELQAIIKSIEQVYRKKRIEE